MRKFLRRFFCALLSLVLVAAVSTAIAVPAVIRSRGDLSDYMVSEEFQESIGKANAKRAKDTSARIMSANLLVHYESWGGTDAHKRAKMFLQVLDTYRPDVVAVQEMSDQWYCCLMQNRGSYKLLYPVRTGALVRMTGLLYDSDRVTLLEQGDVAYDRGDDARLRRIVWGLFRNNQSGEKYIVSSTHLDLIRSGEEKAERAVMESQANPWRHSISVRCLPAETLTLWTAAGMTRCMMRRRFTAAWQKRCRTQKPWPPRPKAATTKKPLHLPTTTFF